MSTPNTDPLPLPRTDVERQRIKLLELERAIKALHGEGSASAEMTWLDAAIKYYEMRENNRAEKRGKSDNLQSKIQTALLSFCSAALLIICVGFFKQYGDSRELMTTVVELGKRVTKIEDAFHLVPKP